MASFWHFRSYPATTAVQGVAAVVLPLVVAAAATAPDDELAPP